MVRTGENRIRRRRRESARAAISPRGLVAPGVPMWVYGTRENAAPQEALRPLQNAPESGAPQRASAVNMVRFGSLGDPDCRSIEGPGVHRRGLSGAA